MYINRITSIPSEPAKSRLCSFTEESVECTATSLNNKVVMGEKFAFSVPPGLRTIRRESSRTELYSVREVWVGIQSRPTITQNLTTCFTNFADNSKSLRIFADHRIFTILLLMHCE